MCLEGISICMVSPVELDSRVYRVLECFDGQGSFGGGIGESSVKGRGYQRFRVQGLGFREWGSRV